jgi:hypothetical protein
LDDKIKVSNIADYESLLQGEAYEELVGASIIFCSALLWTGSFLP